MPARSKAPKVAKPRISLREEQKRSTHDRIVKVAARLFEQSGYSAVAVSDIATAANVNRATFYLHFTGKADVLQVAMERLLDETVLGYWKALDQALVSGSRTAIRIFIADVAEWWSVHSTMVSAWDEALRVDSASLSRLSQIPDTLFDHCQEYLGTLGSEEEKSDARRKIELLMLQVGPAGRRSWLRDKSSPDYDAYLDSLTDIWCATFDIRS